MSTQDMVTVSNNNSHKKVIITHGHHILCAHQFLSFFILVHFDIFIFNAGRSKKDSFDRINSSFIKTSQRWMIQIKMMGFSFRLGSIPSFPTDQGYHQQISFLMPVCKKDLIYSISFLVPSTCLSTSLTANHDYFYSQYYQYFLFKPASSLSLTQPLADFEAEYIRLKRRQRIYPLNHHLPQISDLSIVSCPSRTLLLFLKNIYLFRDTDVWNSLMDSVGEGEGGKIWENGIETCTRSCMK